MSTTETNAAPVEAVPEGSFGVKPATEQVDTLSAVMSALQTNGKLSKPSDSDTPKPPAQTPATDEEDKATDTEAAPTDPAEPAPEPTHESKDEKKPGWQKRIDKLTADKKEAEETYAKEKADLEARISELENKPAAEPDAPEAPAPTGLLALDSQAAVDTHRQQLEQLKDVLDDYKTTGWEGTDANGEPSEMSPEMIKARLQEVRDELRQLPQIEKALRTRDEKFRPQLTERYEWWGDQSDPRHTEAQTLLRQFPELRRAPNHELLIANHVAMEHQIKQAAAAPAKPAKPATKVQTPSSDDPPPVPSTSPAAPATHRATPSAKLSGEALSGVQRGDRTALASFVSSFMSRQ